jgi:hypothetical protein
MIIRVTGFDVDNTWALSALAAIADQPGAFVIAAGGHAIVTGTAKLRGLIHGGAEFEVDDPDEFDDEKWAGMWSHMCTVFAACAALEQQRVEVLAAHIWGRP